MKLDDEFDLSPLSATVLENAERVLGDARILFDAGSYATACALACVSIEEAGKACLILWRDKGLIKRDIAKDVRDHHAKHRVFAGLKEALSFVPLLTEKMDADDLARRIETEVLDPNRESSFLAKLGAFDAFKQYGFYVDVDDQTHFQPTKVIYRKDAEYLLAEASQAIVLVKEVPAVHFVACGMYLEEEAPKRDPKMMREIRELMASRKVRPAIPENQS
ncbi:AbiV family abortive infection protein [Mesorhizobium sp. M0815]|uniref:AbiV family abortive infection protein n=1 Tax=Mesorhizobium sp. M0815 TaxID=2957005 RepID=UPI003336722B